MNNISKLSHMSCVLPIQICRWLYLTILSDIHKLIFHPFPWDFIILLVLVWIYLCIFFRCMYKNKDYPTSLVMCQCIIIFNFKFFVVHIKLLAIIYTILLVSFLPMKFGNIILVVQSKVGNYMTCYSGVVLWQALFLNLYEYISQTWLVLCCCWGKQQRYDFIISYLRPCHTFYVLFKNFGKWQSF